MDRATIFPPLLGGTSGSQFTFFEHISVSITFSYISVGINFSFMGNYGRL